MWENTIATLEKLSGRGVTTWLSMEPLPEESFIPRVLEKAFESAESKPVWWAVIGAASEGNKYIPPTHEAIKRMLRIADLYEIPLFFKGNLKSSALAASLWREEYPFERDFE